VDDFDEVRADLDVHFSVAESAEAAHQSVDRSCPNSRAAPEERSADRCVLRLTGLDRQVQQQVERPGSRVGDVGHLFPERP
jgi:hypothetical protein